MKDYTNEIWRDVVGAEGLYQVSNWGRVKSLNYHRTGQEQILKPQKTKYGYLTVNLYKGEKMKTCKVHRLVSTAFIPNPDNLPQVNHINEVKTDNFVFLNEDGSVDFSKSNLEWITAKKNCNHRTRNERIGKANTNGKCSKRVAQKTKDGKLVKIWLSIMEVHRQTGWSCGNISQCCLGKRKSAYNSIWEFID